MLRFESGATGLLFCSVATATNFCFTLYGSKGLAEISQARPAELPLRADLGRGADRAGDRAARRDRRAPDVRHAARRDDAFARAIRDRTPYPVPVDDVLHGMAVFDAIVESAQTGKIVTVAGRSDRFVISARHCRT